MSAIQRAGLFNTILGSSMLAIAAINSPEVFNNTAATAVLLLLLGGAGLVFGPGEKPK